MGGSGDRGRLLDAVGDGVVVLDAAGRFVDVNESFLDLTGYDRETLLDAELSLVYGADAGVERAVESLHDASPDRTETVAASVETADEERIPVEANLSPLAGDGGRVVAVVRDVTGREERERELERYERLLEVSGDGVYALDAEGRFTYTNEALLGYDESELLGEHASTILTEAAAERGEEVIRDLIRSDDRRRATYEQEVVTKDGERVPTENHVALLYDEDGEFRGSVGVVRDVSERKARERELARYEQMVGAMGDGVYALDAEGRYTMVNEYLVDLLGHDRDRLLGAEASLVHDDEEIERFEAAIESLVSGEADDDVKTVEASVETADGESVPVEVNLTLLYDEEGEFRGTVGVLRDVSERKARERELERYERLIEASGDAVYALDTEGRFTFSNEAHQDIVGRPESELLGRHASVSLPDEAVENGRRLIQELVESDDRRCGTYEMDVLRPDGERVPTENHVALLTDEDGEFRGTVGVLRDISERKAREQELRRQNERLERFASVVSHDLRNPLNVAQGYAETVDDPAGAEIRRSLDRMEAIVEEVLELARQGRTIDDPEPVALRDVAETAWDTVDTGDATLAVETEATVLADEGRLAGVLENLFRNSVEHGSTSPASHTRQDPAGASSGEPSVADASEDAVEHRSTSPDSQARGDAPEHGGDDLTVTVGATDDGFYVADDGPGIPDDEHDRVFEMGYTTSEDGTGFGLAIVEEVASAHGWDVAVTDSTLASDASERSEDEHGESSGARFEFAGVERVGDSGRGTGERP